MSYSFFAFKIDNGNQRVCKTIEICYRLKYELSWVTHQDDDPLQCINAGRRLSMNLPCSEIRPENSSSIKHEMSHTTHR